MALRLLFWRRPKPESAGRHVRATALLVPDSTGALTALSAPDELPSAAPSPEAVAPGLPSPDAPAVEPERRAVGPAPSAGPVEGATAYDDGLDATAPTPAVAAPVERAAASPPHVEDAAEAGPPSAPEGATIDPPPEAVPRAAISAVVAPATPPTVAVAGVALGFADGASVELHPDDPRVTSFRAAAAALLDAHEA